MTQSRLELGDSSSPYHMSRRFNLRPARHWSHYYEEFTRAAEKNAGHPAIVMQKDQFGPLALVAALWRKDYPAIPRYARLRDVPADNSEALARIVRERARPVGAPERSGIPARIDTLVTRVMAVALPKSFAV